MSRRKSTLTEEQRMICARCGQVRWYHEPGRAWATDHEFTTVWQPAPFRIKSTNLPQASLDKLEA